MKQCVAEVEANAEVMPDVFLLHLSAPYIAAHGLPGQFVHVNCGEGSDPLLRRPLSLHRIGGTAMGGDCAGTDEAAEGSEMLPARHWMPRAGQIAVLLARLGKGTAMLSRAKPGEILSVIGPLGNGFRFEPTTRNVLLVAGGVGIAPLIALADAAIAREMTVTLLVGARSARGVMPAAMLPPQVEYVVCTDDGSQGRSGLVTALVPEFVDWADQIFACGPRPMIQALSELRLPSSKSVQVALEQHMACGIGACLGCVVRTRSGLQRVCRDGPVFELKDLRWQ